MTLIQDTTDESLSGADLEILSFISQKCSFIINYDICTLLNLRVLMNNDLPGAI